MTEHAKRLRDIEANNARRLYEAESDYLIAAADYIERLEAVNGQLAEACERVGDRRMWRNASSGLMWFGETAGGNEIETADPRDILDTALAAAKEEG